MGLCLSNTSQRVSSYTKLIPALSFLQKEESMYEFRHKHEDPEIGIFYSRLTLANLEKNDREKASGYAQILKEWMDKDYEKFLHNFSSSTHPFLHELRIHAFRRDKKFMQGMAAGNEEKKRKAFFIAYKENLILEKYFGRTIRKYVYKWDKEKIKETEEIIDKSQSYVSPVSTGLFTSLDEKKMWLSILVFLAGMVFFNIFYSRLKKPR